MSNQNFPTYVKVVKNSRFFSDFCSKFKVFLASTFKFQAFPGFQVLWQPCFSNYKN